MKKKKIIKLFIIVIAVIIIAIVINLIYKNFIKFKMKNILAKNDSINYELIEKYGDEEVSIKVYADTLISEYNDNITWINSEQGKRVILDKKYKMAILTENDNNLKVNSLNYTYLNEYFENSREKFKYLGKENSYYKFQFTNKDTKIVTILYLNKDINSIEKMIRKINDSEEVITFDVKKNSVSKKEVEYPDLSEYEVTYSSSTNVETNNYNDENLRGNIE